ncbi:uncharacterized protein LOC131623675 [Vicia villosa]|uniref:uncharacterized protein LOC131623675 n=1 Tax=Vicia villosa TaxID=3911 RepID=UPI00273B0FEF|nr:uncharacterized protein LOC131623675 [Vicia villosa]
MNGGNSGLNTKLSVFDGKNWNRWMIEKRVLFGAPNVLDLVYDAIEHSKDLSIMGIQELQSSLEAQDLCLVERTFKREVGQALKASSCKKIQDPSSLEAKKRHGGSQMLEASNSNEKKHQKGREKLDKKKIQCYCCNNFGHYASECWSKKGKKYEEANIAREYNDEPLILMASDSDNSELLEWWYMDIGRSNHMTRNKQWLIDFDSRKIIKVKCVDDKFVNAKGMRNVGIKVKNDKTILVKDVWYVPGMKRNLMSVG